MPFTVKNTFKIQGRTPPLQNINGQIQSRASPKLWYAIWLKIIFPFSLIHCFTALVINMRILKFKSQLTIAFFAAVNHLNGPLRKQKLYFNGFKRSWFVIRDWWISIHFVCFCVSRFVACDRNYDWRQRKTQLWRQLLNFRVRMFVKSAVMPSLECF